MESDKEDTQHQSLHTCAHASTHMCTCIHTHVEMHMFHTHTQIKTMEVYPILFLQHQVLHAGTDPKPANTLANQYLRWQEGRVHRVRHLALSWIGQNDSRHPGFSNVPNTLVCCHFLSCFVSYCELVLASCSVYKKWASYQQVKEPGEIRNPVFWDLNRSKLE
jgi:hypothetical protein